MANKRILITGGAGFIGSHTNKLLNRLGYNTIVFDNLVYGHKDFIKWGEFIEGDLSDKTKLHDVFKNNHIDAVVHFAAYAYVGESVTEPKKYYENNVGCTMNLLEAMLLYGVKSIVFSSTCATYGVPNLMPIMEDMPQNPINPYGMTKLIVEKILSDYSNAYNLNYVALRYFNAAGADPDGEIGEWHNPETHLIPLVLAAAGGQRESIKVFGDDYSTNDGTCIRDYIHVEDLASAHELALAYLLNGGESNYFNLGNGQGHSVKEIIDSAKRVTGVDFKVEIDKRRAGDPPILIGSSDKIKKVLGWNPNYSDIDIIIKHAWNWYKNLNNI